MTDTIVRELRLRRFPDAHPGAAHDRATRALTLPAQRLRPSPTPAAPDPARRRSRRRALELL